MGEYRVLDLFSGIGGFSLGLERTGGFKTIAFCEIDPFCREILEKHWPDVPIFHDIKTLSRLNIPNADVICGGFPCQPFSTASSGKRKGQDDDRYLWPDMFRLIREIRPTWVIGENVAGIEGLALEQVVSDLESNGYQVAPPFEIPACAVGHDHRRTRYWFLAHSDMRGQHERAFNAKAQMLPWIDPHTRGMGKTYGIPDRMDALGNAVVPQIPEIIGRAILNAAAKRELQGKVT